MTMSKTCAAIGATVLLYFGGSDHPASKQGDWKVTAIGPSAPPEILPRPERSSGWTHVDA